jgi:phosphatidylglycerophosphate synthase
MSKYEKGDALPFEESLYNTINPVIGPFLHEKVGLTPNGITTITLILGIIILYLIYNNNYILATVLLIIRQVLDATDGYVARRYNLQSEFGNSYDEYSDAISGIPILIYIGLYYKEFIFDNYLWFVPLVFVFIGLRFYRDKCIKKTNEACTKPEIRHEVLKATKYLSYFEIKLILWLAIINIGIKRDAL